MLTGSGLRDLNWFAVCSAVVSPSSRPGEVGGEASVPGSPRFQGPGVQGPVLWGSGERSQAVGFWGTGQTLWGPH